MSKFKKIFATMIGTAMSANVLLTMPFSAFADNISQTFEFDGYTVGYEVKNSWGNTEVIALTLTNTGTETIEDWMLYFDPNGEIQYVNDAVQMTTTNGIWYIKNPGYNADINPGASVEFRYAVNDCEEIPSDYKFCQSRMTKETGYDVSLKVNYTWGSNNEYFNGEIIIQNDTDAPIEAWELKADTNFTITEITNSWAADVTELEPYNYMLKGTYTSVIPVGGSISLGFNGMKEGEPIISDYSLTEVVVDESVINSIINGSNKDDEFYDDCIDWSTLPDSDGDGLPDEYEEEYGCDPTNPDTDGDGLPDGYEIMTIGSNPADAYSLDSTLSDGEYDNDQDGLSNYEEYLLGTDPLRTDSDFDGLSDGDEVNVYGTDPLNPDTDGDGLSDGDEIALGLNPLVTDSNGDGISDNEEKFSQDMTYNTEDSDTVIDSINVSFEGTGYINSTTSVENIMDTDWMCSNVVGLVGAPYDISSDSSFDTATLTFTVDKSSLGDTQFDDLAVLWYNEKEQRFVEMETIPDVAASTLTTTVEHFSKYLIVDCSRWYAAWSENNYPFNGNTLHTAITIDCSSSMIGNDPNNYRITAANSFVDVMNAADLASVIFFADGADEKQELTNDQEALKNAIDDVFSAGTTNYAAALRYSIDSLEKQPDSNADDIIIFLSDGRPTNVVDGSGIEIPENEFDYSLVDEAASKGIRIYTIGLTNHVNENILKEMANRTNGEYYYANTAKELISYFLTVNMGEKYDIITDTDEDGIPDLFETYGMPVANGQVLFSDPEIKDTDGDGLEDGEEVIMHIVDDADEVKAAYNYMYGSIPEPFISNNGGIYFTMVADPEDEDTDKDHITDGDEVKQVGEGGIAERYGIQSYDDYEYTIDSHYYDYENNVSLLDPLNEDTIESLYPEFKNEDFNNPTNPVYYSISQNEITVQLRTYFTGIYDELLNGRTRKEIVKEGICENWNNEFTGTVYDFYPGLPVKIEFVFTERESEFNSSTDKAFVIDITDSLDRSSASRASYSSDGDTGCLTMRNHRYVESSYKKVAAHEFGHILGLHDAYNETDRDLDFYSITQDEFISNKEIMRSSINGEVVINDIEMALYSAINDDWENFTPSTNRSISMAIRSRQLYRYGLSYYVTNEPYIKGVDYVWFVGKGYIPKNSVIETTTSSGVDILYFKENVDGNTTITIFGLSDETYSGEVVIPDTIEGYYVTRIADGAFRDANISSVTFENPDNILTIGQAAFYNCKNLITIDIPSGINIIRPFTFQHCENISEVTIPNSVVKIQQNSFSDCSSLKNVIIPEGVTTIGYAAFSSCALEKVEIPSSINKMGNYVFIYCPVINTVKFNSDDPSGYANDMFWYRSNSEDNILTVFVPNNSVDVYNHFFGEFLINSNIELSIIQ